jgi:hypothetical protein
MLSHGRDRISLVRFLYRALRPVSAPESMLETTSPSLLVRLKIDLVGGRCRDSRGYTDKYTREAVRGWDRGRSQVEWAGA